jgi:hypothetical protein
MPPRWPAGCGVQTLVRMHSIPHRILSGTQACDTHLALPVGAELWERQDVVIVREFCPGPVAGPVRRVRRVHRGAQLGADT